MKSTKLLIASIALAILTGCANTDYEKYLSTHQSIAVATAQAQSSKYKAIADIAAGGDETSKVAALISLMQQGQGTSQQVAAPRTTEDRVREWLGVLAPVAVQGYSSYNSTRLGIAQSNNSVRGLESTNSTFAGIAGRIQSSNTNSYSNAVTLSGTGVLGGDYTRTEQSPVITPVTPIVPVVVIPNEVGSD